MLSLLENIFTRKEIQSPSGEFIKLHSNTSKEQGIFLQEIFEKIKPEKSLEVGLAYGISSLFILEKHRAQGSSEKAHIIIEPYPWGGVAEYNIDNEGLSYLADIRYHKSDVVLPQLYFEKHRIQFAYVDTTKLFDIVMQDVYFIDKILDVGGVLILDDCGGSWSGIQKVARFIHTLPHYKFMAGHAKSNPSKKLKLAEFAATFMTKCIPYRRRIFPYFNFLTDRSLNLNYNCIAFKKISEDERDWKWDRPF